LVGDHQEAEIKLFLEDVCKDGSVVDTHVGVISSYNVNLLAVNGGLINITKGWAKRLLGRMGQVKRCGTTKAKINPLDFEVLKQQYLELRSTWKTSQQILLIETILGVSRG